MMKYPNLSEEKKLWRQGYQTVIGLDEAGRGPLAGPVVAGAVSILNTKYKILYTKVRDSKKLTPRQRDQLYDIIIRDPDIKWGIGVVSEKVIDKINILQATKMAMVKALRDLDHKLPKISDPGSTNCSLTTGQADEISKNQPIIHLSPRTIRACRGLVRGRVNLVRSGFLLLDGKMELALPLAQKSIVRADEKVFSCAVASIIAKVTRDRLMAKYHQKYPRYRFDRHKGYPTKLHLKMLRKYGPSKIHRLSFGPVLKA